MSINSVYNATTQIEEDERKYKDVYLTKKDKALNARSFSALYTRKISCPL